MDSCPRSSKRKPNFTESENMYLVQEFEKHRTILNSRLTSVETNRGKQHVWQEICIGLNTLNNDQGKAERTVKEIRRKWKNMVTSAKRHAKQLKGTPKDPHGRSLKPLSALSQKIIEMKTESANAEDGTDNDAVIVEIKTEQEEDGYRTECISKKGPLEVFYSSDAATAAVVVPPGADDNQTDNPPYSPSSSDGGSISEMRTADKHGTGACEIESHEIDDDEAVELETSCAPARKARPFKRVSSVTTDSAAQLSRKFIKRHSTTSHIQCELSELKKEKLQLQIEKLKSEKDKLGMEKERLGLEIQFWKKKLESTQPVTSTST